MGLETSKIPALPKVVQSDPSRLHRSTAEMANVLNALLRRGDITKLGPADYTIPGRFTDGEQSAALMIVATFNKPGVASAAENVTNKLIIPGNLTFLGWKLLVDLAPDGADFIMDINLNGTSLWAATPANRPTMLDGQTGPVFGTDFDTTEAEEDDLLSMDIDQVGSVYPGRRITFQLICELTGG